MEEVNWYIHDTYMLVKRCRLCPIGLYTDYRAGQISCGQLLVPGLDQMWSTC